MSLGTALSSLGTIYFYFLFSFPFSPQTFPHFLCLSLRLSQILCPSLTFFLMLILCFSLTLFCLSFFSPFPLPFLVSLPAPLAPSLCVPFSGNVQFSLLLRLHSLVLSDCTQLRIELEEALRTEHSSSISPQRCTTTEQGLRQELAECQAELQATSALLQEQVLAHTLRKPQISSLERHEPTNPYFCPLWSE